MASLLTSLSLAGRSALVTGGAGHLGQAICRGLAEAGAHVVINGRDRDRAEKFAAALRKAGHSASVEAFILSMHIV